MNTETEGPKHARGSSDTATLAKPKAVPAPSSWDDEDEEKTAFQKFRLPVIVGIVLAVGIGFVAKSLSGKSSAPPPKQEVVMVHTIPQATPPPPVPTPPPMEVKKEEMLIPEKQQEPDPDPTPEIKTMIKGPASGGIVLKQGNDTGIFKPGTTVDAKAMRRSAYAGQVKSRIQQALESNPRTRKVGMTIEIRVWPDSAGRITRAKLETSTGDPKLDDFIRDEVLTGLQVPQPPPEGMPAFIRMRITARRPN